MDGRTDRQTDSQTSQTGRTSSSLHANISLVISLSTSVRVLERDISSSDLDFFPLLLRLLISRLSIDTGCFDHLDNDDDDDIKSMVAN